MFRRFLERPFLSYLGFYTQAILHHKDTDNRAIYWRFCPPKLHRLVIGSFQVSLSLSYKASLSAKFMINKLVPFSIWMKTDFHNKDFALSLALKWRLRWIRKWPIHSALPFCFRIRWYACPLLSCLNIQKRLSFVACRIFVPRITSDKKFEKVHCTLKPPRCHEWHFAKQRALECVRLWVKISRSILTSGLKLTQMRHAIPFDIYWVLLCLPLGKCWNSKFSLFYPILSLMVKPLSAITMSPGKSLLRNP